MPCKYSVLILICLLASGCAKNTDGTWKAPLVYRVDVQQGNVVDQAMINKLKPGMDKNQVRFIMGTPLLMDPFHSNRWDYLYSFEPGGGEREQRRISIFFKDEKLAYVDGDIEITHVPVNPEEDGRGKTVVVPIEDHEEGFFTRTWDNITSDDDEETTEESPEPTEETESEVSEATEKADTKPSGQEEDTALLNETPDTEPEQDVDDISGQEAAAEVEPDDTEEEDTQKKTEKSLIRRFWDRMTSSEEDSTETEEETERDRQDAEVFKEAGGGL